MKIFGIFILVVVIASPAYARASSLGSSSSFFYFDVSGISCGQWDSHRTANTSIYHEMYIVGFLTSYNIYTGNMYNILGNSDLESTNLFIDKYCNENPLSHVSIGLKKLIEKLLPLAHTKPPGEKN